MRVIDLGGGHDEDYDDEIYDRRGGRGRSRRSDGTYMGYGGGIYDHYGKEHDGRMDELERRERELEKRERLHEREDEMYRRGWFGERGIRDEFDGTEPYMRMQSATARRCLRICFLKKPPTSTFSWGRV